MEWNISTSVFTFGHLVFNWSTNEYFPTFCTMYIWFYTSDIIATDYKKAIYGQKKNWIAKKGYKREWTVIWEKNIKLWLNTETVP